MWGGGLIGDWFGEVLSSIFKFAKKSSEPPPHSSTNSGGAIMGWLNGPNLRSDCFYLRKDTLFGPKRANCSTPIRLNLFWGINPWSDPNVFWFFKNSTRVIFLVIGIPSAIKDKVIDAAARHAPKMHVS